MGLWWGDDDHEEEGYRRRLSSRALARRVLPYFRPHRAAFVLGAVLMAAAALAELAAPLILRALVDGPVLSGDRQQLYRLAALFGAVVLASMFLAWLQVVVVARAGLAVVQRLKGELFDHVLSLSMAYFDRNPPGRLLARVESDTERLRQLFSEVAMALARSAVLLVGTIAVLLVTAPIITAAILALGLPILALIPWALGRVRRLYAEVRRRYARVSTFITEFVRGLDVIQIYGYAPHALARLVRLNREKAASEIRAELTVYAFFGIFVAFEVCAVAVALWLGTGRLAAGMTVGTLVLFIEYARRLFVPIAAFSEQAAFVQRAFASADRVMELLDTPSLTRDRPGVRTRVPDGWQELTFEELGHLYEGAAAPALQGVSFRLRRGEHLALVGPSGGGKTTIGALLLRLYEPTSGRIALDGIDAREFALEAWRRHLGLVPQDIHLFPGTVGENLRALREDVPQEAVLRALEAARVDRLVERLPQGLDTPLAEGGVNLSMGERQLLCFARAVVDDPPLLLLDEATSSVDPATERRLQASLERIRAGRSSITIAHRLSTIEAADRVLVIDGGRIIEEGRHEALLAAGGLYRELVDLQRAQPSSGAPA